MPDFAAFLRVGHSAPSVLPVSHMPWVLVGKIVGAAGLFFGSYLLSAFMNDAVVSQPDLNGNPNGGITIVIVHPPAEVKAPPVPDPTPLSLQDLVLPL